MLKLLVFRARPSLYIVQITFPKLIFSFLIIVARNKNNNVFFENVIVSVWCHFIASVEELQPDPRHLETIKKLQLHNSWYFDLVFLLGYQLRRFKRVCKLIQKTITLCEIQIPI